MIELIGKTNIDFLGKRKFFYIVSLLASVLSVYVWIDRGESRYDVDFTGGHEFVVQAAPSADSEELRKILEENKISDAIVQSFERESNQYSVRIGGENKDTKALRTTIEGALKAKYGEAGQVLQTEFVGPTVGKELKVKAQWAVFLALIVIVIFVAFRFEFSFALGALVALGHDVIVATGVYLATGHNINMGAVAAALTIVGYSINDTIVIFDKVREEAHKRKDFDLITLMNECVNMMLSRTIITSVLTLSTAITLYLFGGGAIADLSFYLTIGIICGSYSTVFIASPVVFTWESIASRRKGKAVTA